MPVPLIIIFITTPSTPEDGALIDKFAHLNFLPLIDAMHQEQYDWFHKNYTNAPHRFYLLKEDKIFDYTLQDVTPETFYGPDFIISFQETESITMEDWRDIHFWLNHHLCTNPTTPPPLTSPSETEQLARATALLTPPPIQINPAPEVEIPNHTVDYEFETKLDSINDVCFYQVNKPYTDLPYTTITRDFSQHGHTPFFTSLFIADSWGVSSADIVFLSKAWAHLNMEGEFNLERMYMERVQGCFKGAPEPEVFRRTIPQVQDTLEAQRKGIPCGHKRKRFVPQELWTKISKK